MIRKRRTRRNRTDRKRHRRSTLSDLGDSPRSGYILPATVLVVLLILAALGDDRYVGLIADGRQMIRTAVAIAETGEIGQARGRDFTVARPQGDAVSRFGMATSLFQVPAALLAPHLEMSLGPGSSQALFLVVPWVAIGIAAAAAGTMARMLGGGNLEVALAVVLASVGSPLGSYAALEFSEPVQAATLIGALAAALAAAQSSGSRHRLEFAAGFAAGLAVLTKSSLIVAAPATLLPLVDPGSAPRTRRALFRAAAGAAGPLMLWVIFELLRFGRMFGGYPDDRFTHPWFDGVWRLLIGANRGLLLFWPPLLLFAWTAVRWRHDWMSSAAARAWFGAVLVLVIQIAVAAGYWGWHGMEGWGPRLIVSAVPLLAPFAALSPVPRVVLVGMTALSVIVNIPPFVQHPTPVATYITNVAWPEIPESERWRYPFYGTATNASGHLTVVPFEVLEDEAAANPWRVYLWVRWLSGMEDQRLAEKVMAPPWKQAQPNLVPAAAWPPEIARRIIPPPRLGFLGRSLTGTGGPYASVYLDALLDQVVRANQQNRIARALDLSQLRITLTADGEAAAWHLETLRRAGRANEAEPFLRSLPVDTRRHPLINVALALFDRDFIEEQRAKALLRSVADSFPDSPVQKALTQPLAEWPQTLDALTATPRRDASIAAPR